MGFSRANQIPPNFPATLLAETSRLTMTQSENGSFSLHHSNKSQRCDLERMQSSLPFMNLRKQTVVLRDSQGKMFGIMVKTSSIFGKPVTTNIYGFTPSVADQLPCKDQHHEGRCLYKWAEIAGSTIKMADGEMYETRREFGEEWKVIADMGDVFIENSSNGQECARLEKQGRQAWDVTLGRGVDPLLLVCSTVIVGQ